MDETKHCKLGLRTLRTVIWQACVRLQQNNTLRFSERCGFDTMSRP